MDVKNCRQCNKMFNYIGGAPLCPDCIRKAEEKFDETKAYIYDHPKCGMQEVSEAVGVSVAQIRKWLKEERLAFSEDSEIALNCEKCMKKILTGRYCNACKKELENAFVGMYKKDEPRQPRYERQKTENKMRFLGDT